MQLINQWGISVHSFIIHTRRLKTKCGSWMWYGMLVCKYQRFSWLRLQGFISSAKWLIWNPSGFDWLLKLMNSILSLNSSKLYYWRMMIFILSDTEALNVKNAQIVIEITLKTSSASPSTFSSSLHLRLMTFFLIICGLFLHREKNQFAEYSTSIMINKRR